MIWVTQFLRHPNHILEITDNGSGITSGINIKNPETLGLIIVNNLCQQIGAEFEFDRIDDRCIFRIKFQN